MLTSPLAIFFIWIGSLCCFLTPLPVNGAGFADSPYLGWSSWSLTASKESGYGGGWMNQTRIEEQSDAMKKYLSASGFAYINLDAGWSNTIDQYGRPAPDTKKFPDIKSLAAYVNKNGQKFGLYWSPGLPTEAESKNVPIMGTNCHAKDIVIQPLTYASHFKNSWKMDFKNNCTLAYYDSVAEALHSYGAVYLKLDAVAPGSEVAGYDNRDDIKAISDALKPYQIWLELSSAVDIEYASFWKSVANGWRITGDIECYHCPSPGLTSWARLENRFTEAPKWVKYASAGGWNDFDSMDIGNGNMDGVNADERQSYMTLWVISCVPMYLGDDLTKLDSTALSMLTNMEVVSINQAGKPATPVSQSSSQQAWYINYTNGTSVVALFNLGTSTANVKVTFSDVGAKSTVNIRDLWAKKDLGSFTDSYQASLPSHGSRLLKLTT